MFDKKLSENETFVDDKGEGIFGEKVNNAQLDCT